MQENVEYNEMKGKAKKSLKVYLLEMAQKWINSLLEAEMTELLRRDRYEPSGEPNPNYRNGYRPRNLNLMGMGKVEISVPRDRNGEYRSQFLPNRKGQDAEFESFISECFLAGLSTRDISRITEKHFGTRYDSKQVSRIVERATEELEAWRTRPLNKTKYKMLFTDGTNVTGRVGGKVCTLSFCVVMGISETEQRIEILATMMGERENRHLWADLFKELQGRGLDMEGVELGIMDGLPGLEEEFRRYFPNAQSQRCQKHAAANAMRRVRSADREAFHKDINKIFYAPTESEARKAFREMKEQWKEYPGAVGVIERDLDSLLRFFHFDPTYWATIRTTNPIERLNKEIKRRIKAMEITGGELSTYRLITYVAMTMNYRWSFHPITQWSHVYNRESKVSTHNAA